MTVAIPAVYPTLAIMDRGSSVGRLRWIGAKAGLIAIAEAAGGPAGHADFDYFRFSA